MNMVVLQSDMKMSSANWLLVRSQSSGETVSNRCHCEGNAALGTKN